MVTMPQFRLKKALSRLLEMRSVFGDVRNSLRTIIKRIMPTCFPQMDTCANPTKVRALRQGKLSLQTTIKLQKIFKNLKKKASLDYS